MDDFEQPQAGLDWKEHNRQETAELAANREPKFKALNLSDEEQLVMCRTHAALCRACDMHIQSDVHNLQAGQGSVNWKAIREASHALLEKHGLPTNAEIVNKS